MNLHTLLPLAMLAGLASAQTSHPRSAIAASCTDDCMLDAQDKATLTAEPVADVHRQMLARLARAAAPDSPLAFCFAGTVPWRTMEAFETALRDGREYQFYARWLSSATTLGPVGRGDPIVLTYSFLPDGVSIPSGVGEPTAASNLFAVLDAIQGRTTWQTRVHQTFGRWAARSGITFTYEPTDDGAPFPDSPGALGQRGDIRVGGHYIDGQSGGNILAYAYYPHTGDIVFDTSNTSFFGDATSDALRFRNTLAHEIGHTVGVKHVCPYDNTKLMEAYLSVAFDGPQHDELRGIQRWYGDRLENNDTGVTATDLGPLAGGMSVSNVSIDDADDSDWYRFTLDAAEKVSITLTPLGATYLEGPQTNGCTGVVSVNSLVSNDLGFELYDGGGTMLLRRVDDHPAGSPEVLADFVLWSGPGTYYVRVFGGPVREVQLYSLRLESTEMARVLRTFAGTASGDEFGAALAGLGDVDGDGYAELLVGAPGARTGGVATGTAQVFSGRTRGVLLAAAGAAAGDEFGRAVAAAGDVDRDGVVDLAIGAPGDDTAGPDSGCVHFLSGRTGAPIRIVRGAAAGERFGSALVGMGDANLDGVPDLAVGAPLSDTVRFVSGSDGQFLATLSPGSPGSRFGAALGAADVNRDGFADVIAGAPFDSGNGTSSGSVLVLSGFLGRGEVLHTLRGAAANENFGIAVAGAGDINRDQYGDVLVGALADQRSTRGSGYAVVISGRDGREIRRFAGTGPADRFGYAVAALGDVDGDATPDVAVGAPGSGPGDPGYATVLSGRGSELVAVPGETPGGGFGVVTFADDVDGDGWLDVAVGAPRGGDAGQGVVRVFSTTIDLRAGTKPIGTGCGGGTAPPSLTTGLPELGRTVGATIREAAPNRAGSLLGGTVVPSPLPIGGGCRLYLGLAQVVALGSLFTSSSGAGGTSVRLPHATPDLVGSQLAVQAIVLPTSGPLGFDLTNGVIWTLR